MPETEQRLAILLHEGIQGQNGKTGLALLRYRRRSVVVVIDHQSVGMSLAELTGVACNVPIVGSVEEALAYQPNTLAIGIAPSGGVLPADWRAEVKVAAAVGLDIFNGLHTRLATDPEFQAVMRPGQQIWDIRQEPPGLRVGSGQARDLSCKRVLTVGTDMGVGKMSTSLELHAASLRWGVNSKFVATGQAGIMISGEGVPLDAVRVDFAAGAVEQAVVKAAPDHDILHIEGQGSLLHPGSTATLSLIRGSQPTHLVLVHRARQSSIRNHPQVPIPPLPEVVRLYEMVVEAAGAFAPAKVVAIALNTAHLDTSTALDIIEQVEAQTQLPCTDPVRFGGESLLRVILD